MKLCFILRTSAIICILVLLTNGTNISFAQANSAGQENFPNLKWKPYNSQDIPKIKRPINDNLRYYRNNQKSFFSDRDSLFNNDYNKNTETPYKWEKLNGPFGGDVRKFYEFNNILYALSDREIYKYENDKWVALNFEHILCNIITCMHIYESGKILVGCDWGLYYSDNNGTGWNMVPKELGYLGINDLILKDGDILLSTDDGIYKSKDDQVEFIKFTLQGIRIMSVNFDNSGNIWAGTNGDIYRAKYSDLVWQKFNLENNFYNKVIFDSKGTIYSISTPVVYRSRNSGKTWDYMEGDFTDISIYSDMLLITGMYHLYKADNQGVFWQSKKSDNFLVHTDIRNGSEFLIGSLGAGVLKYNVEKDEFTLFNTGMNSSTVRSIVPMKNGQLLVSTDAINFYLSNDNGLTWNPTFRQWSIFAKQGKDGSVYAAFASGIIKSTDFGKTWSELNIDVTPYFISAFDLSEDNLTICAGSSTGEVYISNNGGESFQLIKSANYFFVDAVKVIDKKKIIVFNDSLYYTANGGTTLSSVKLEKQFRINDIIMDNDGYIFAAANEGVYRSADGKNWTHLSQYTGENAHGLGLDIYNNIYAVSWYGAVEVSSDNGITWEVLINSIPSTFMTAFAISPDGYLYCGTQGKGLYKFKIDFRKKPAPINYSLSYNFPNPFNSSTRIEYQVPEDTYITLKIYDILGRETETLVSGYKNAGRYYTTWDASQYSSGIYLYRMETNGYSEIKKMVLLR